jgi:hypothetical protein
MITAMMTAMLLIVLLSLNYFRYLFEQSISMNISTTKYNFYENFHTGRIANETFDAIEQLCETGKIDPTSVCHDVRREVKKSILRIPGPQGDADLLREEIQDALEESEIWEELMKSSLKESFYWRNVGFQFPRS